MIIMESMQQMLPDEIEAISRDVSREEGIMVGYSAGSAVAGVNQLKSKLKSTDVVVVIFHDHGTRYVGKLFNDDWMKKNNFI